MIKFDATSRVLFNESGDDLNRQIRAEIEKIETEALQIRKRGGSPELELKPAVDRLRAAIDVGRVETLQEIGRIHAEARADWERIRDKKPEAELAAIRRAENRFKGMGDDDIRALALNYIDGEADLSPIELNEARDRLRQSNILPELDGLNEAAKARRADTPWVSGDPEMSVLADYSETLAQLSGGEVLLSVEGEDRPYQERIDVENLIDFAGELAKTE